MRCCITFYAFIYAFIELHACVYEEFTIPVNRKNFNGKERTRECSEGYWSLNCELVTPNKNAKVNKRRILFIYSRNIGHFEDGVCFHNMQMIDHDDSRVDYQIMDINSLSQLLCIVLLHIHATK